MPAVHRLPYPGNALANSKLPFNIHTLAQLTATDPVTSLAATTTYDYAGGHHFYDPQNAFTREYAGFQAVTVTNPAGNVRKEYFHQSQFAQDNASSAPPQGEFEDHISKKGHSYRSEQYDSTGKLFLLTVRKWNKTQITDANPTEDAFFPYLERETAITYDGQPPAELLPLRMPMTSTVTSSDGLELDERAGKVGQAGAPMTVFAIRSSRQTTAVTTFRAAGARGISLFAKMLHERPFV